MATVKIPQDIESLGARMAGLAALARAVKWERAAIVWAFCQNNGRGRPPKNPRNRVYSLAEFARLGFAGLTTEESVRKYYAAWDEAIQYGKAETVRPGETIELPDLPWPYEPTHVEHAARSNPDLVAAAAAAAAEAGISTNTVLRVVELPGAVRAAIAASPKIADAAREALIARGGDTIGTHTTPKRRRQDRFDITDAEVLRYGAYILAALIAMEDGRYQPSPQAALILAALRPSTDWDAELISLGRG